MLVNNGRLTKVFVVIIDEVAAEVITVVSSVNRTIRKLVVLSP
jgi:hypothetical protein